MKKKHHKQKRYTFSDKVRNIRNKTLNYGINLLFCYILAIPLILYFGNMNVIVIDVVLFLVTSLAMAFIELLHGVVNRREYIEENHAFSEISKQVDKEIEEEMLCCCKANQPQTYNSIASKT